ncbi:MAG: hypothetical protein ACLSFB_09385 [[Clostridium] scindens]
MNQYHQRQLAFSINDFYHYPTLREQIDRLCKRQAEPEEEKKATSDGMDMPRLPRYLPTVPCIPVKEGAALVTGAIGYLGSLSGQGTGGCREEGLLPGKRRRETAV